MKKFARQKMIDAAKLEAERGSIYVWGAQGQRGSALTDAWIRKMETSTTNANRAITYRDKSKKTHSANNIGAFDCSGLIWWIINQNGNPGTDDTANGLLNRCKAITKEQLQPGDFVFEYANGKSSHVGIYIGDGKVVEARGRDYGVCITNLNSRNWKKYGRPDFIYTDATKYVAPSVTAPAEQPKDPYAYVLNSAADLYEYKGIGTAGTPVTLESYFDGDNYARVADKDGKKYIVKWSALKKA